MCSQNSELTEKTRGSNAERSLCSKKQEAKANAFAFTYTEGQMLSGTSLNKLWEKTGKTKISGTPKIKH